MNMCMVTVVSIPEIAVLDIFMVSGCEPSLGRLLCRRGAA
eukprot:CAMPEP_0179418874 /NCGR_PEP_ID=MMETSP0799-20121207/8278_1 /TAXON_ID=46947 /ORGANISM="Geminigera cryophila, Strain CCMP2564" /LENGTH=39 /DNA_ID= /DNA_START= /DNA_END= /DNA_ORIENTATION=